MTLPERTRTAAERLQPLVAAVQANCHVADARHATELTLCTYLLQMREFFRWERGLPFGAALARHEVGAWLAEREALWEQVQGDAWQPLPLPDAGPPADPFDAPAVNARLGGTGLLYGAGIGAGGRPDFFLAELHARTQRDGLPVAVAGHELARGLLAPPAALADEHGNARIVLRRESIARWAWERFEAFRLRPAAGSAFAAAAEAYGLDRDLDAALPRLVDEQAEAALLHEIGEYRVGRRLGPAWAALRQALPTRRGELYARALRDLLADFDVTLPTLLARGADRSLHLWFAAFDGVRAQLYPGLPAAWRAWRGGDGGAALRAACAAGRRHFEALAQDLLRRHAAGGDAAAADIEARLTAAQAICRG
ncbi:MAG: hypothetical protein JSR84_10340 [Proteobacteria bacterium]|nr:hypothetical protein [Pseudomonadota bacterium]